MSDAIIIKALRVAATVGVPDLERCAPQVLELDVVLEGDFRGLGDELARTADYAAVAEWLRLECGRVEFRLIESLVDHLACGLLGNFSGITAVEVEIRKFILPHAAHTVVRVRRGR
jgi:dihydroneopterin aldolase